MSTKKIPLSDATASELADFAAKNLGLDVQYRMGADKIRALMAAAGYQKDTIEIEVPDAGNDPNARVATGEAEAPRKMVMIQINNQPGPGGKEHVPVGVNGKVYLIKRGEPVKVPVEVVHVLENAKTTAYDRGPNGEPINPTDVLKHPFSVLASVAA